MLEQASLYRGHRFPREVIAHAVWLYVRFALSFRDVEDLLADRGVQVSYETVRRWVAKFETQYADELQRRELRACRAWHLDEMATRVGGRVHWLWQAVDEHGQTLDVATAGVARHGRCGAVLPAPAGRGDRRRPGAGFRVAHPRVGSRAEERQGREARARRGLAGELRAGECSIGG